MKLGDIYKIVWRKGRLDLEERQQDNNITKGLKQAETVYDPMTFLSYEDKKRELKRRFGR